MRAALAVFAVTLWVTSTWAATNWREKVLYSFGSGDGSFSDAGLIFDAAGNLYSTTELGGTYGFGTVFELSPAAGGGWTETVLYSFCSQTNCTDGAWPNTGLIFDAAGNLYGATEIGGTYGYGTVFELTPTAGGGWTEKLLHSFGGYPDGGEPGAGLIFDAAGNLYGTTGQDGAYHGGTVFELTPTVGGGWPEKLLHSFSGNGTDGVGPYASLVFDKNGNLYGTTQAGGTAPCGGAGCGTVFELTPTAGGNWTEQVLHNFNDNGTDGYHPGAVIFDAAGNLYGTTFDDGYQYCPGGTRCGTVFELTPTAGGGWTEKVLHSFKGTDGADPNGLIFDAVGNLYSTTIGGGTYNYGTVFELTPTAGGGWTETVLHSFSNSPDGAAPYAGLIFDAAGNLYSTTAVGGTYNNSGTVFELTPVYPCARCVVSGEVDVLPAERRDAPEQGGLTRR